MMSTRMLLFVAAIAAAPQSLVRAADVTLVDAGMPRAEIVIAENPPQLVKVAAEELQSYVAKISGATLPISHVAPQPGTTAIFIGRSAATDALKLDATGLKHGAFRFVVGIVQPRRQFHDSTNAK